MNTTQEDLQNEVEEKVVQFIKEHGPHTTKDILEVLFVEHKLFAKADSVMLPFPEGYMDWVLDESGKVVRGGEGRWHLTSNSAQQEHWQYTDPQSTVANQSIVSARYKHFQVTIWQGVEREGKYIWECSTMEGSPTDQEFMIEVVEKGSAIEEMFCDRLDVALDDMTRLMRKIREKN